MGLTAILTCQMSFSIIASLHLQPINHINANLQVQKVPQKHHSTAFKIFQLGRQFFRKLTSPKTRARFQSAVSTMMQARSYVQVVKIMKNIIQGNTNNNELCSFLCLMLGNPIGCNFLCNHIVHLFTKTMERNKDPDISKYLTGTVDRALFLLHLLTK